LKTCLLNCSIDIGQIFSLKGDNYQRPLGLFMIKLLMSSCSFHLATRCDFWCSFHFSIQNPLFWHLIANYCNFLKFKLISLLKTIGHGFFQYIWSRPSLKVFLNGSFQFLKIWKLPLWLTIQVLKCQIEPILCDIYGMPIDYTPMLTKWMTNYLFIVLIKRRTLACF